MPSIQNSPLSSMKWNINFNHLNPTWYQKEKMIKAIGTACLVIGITTTCLSAFTFTILSPVSFISIALIILGYTCLSKEDYWNDPEYCTRIREEIALNIFTKRTGKDLYRGMNHVLDQNDVETLMLKAQLRNSECTYVLFRNVYGHVKDQTTHGAALAQHLKLDEEEKALLSHKFLEFLKKESESLSYDVFKKRYGIDVDHSDSEKKLFKISPETETYRVLKGKCLSAIETYTGERKGLEQLLTDAQQFFKISKDELYPYEVLWSTKEVMNKRMSYKDFRKTYLKDDEQGHLSLINETMKKKLKTACLANIKKDGETSTQVLLNRYKHDIAFLNISLKEVYQKYLDIQDWEYISIKKLVWDDCLLEIFTKEQWQEKALKQTQRMTFSDIHEKYHYLLKHDLLPASYIEQKINQELQDVATMEELFENYQQAFIDGYLNGSHFKVQALAYDYICRSSICNYFEGNDPMMTFIANAVASDEVQKKILEYREKFSLLKKEHGNHKGWQLKRDEIDKFFIQELVGIFQSESKSQKNQFIQILNNSSFEEVLSYLRETKEIHSSFKEILIKYAQLLSITQVFDLFESIREKGIIKSDELQLEKLAKNYFKTKSVWEFPFLNSDGQYTDPYWEKIKDWNLLVYETRQIGIWTKRIDLQGLEKAHMKKLAQIDKDYSDGINHEKEKKDEVLKTKEKELLSKIRGNISALEEKVNNEKDQQKKNGYERSVERCNIELKEAQEKFDTFQLEMENKFKEFVIKQNEIKEKGIQAENSRWSKLQDNVNMAFQKKLDFLIK